MGTKDRKLSKMLKRASLGRKWWMHFDSEEDYNKLKKEAIKIYEKKTAGN